MTQNPSPLDEKINIPPMPQHAGCSAVVEQQLKGAFGEALINDLLKERRAERRWKVIKRSLFAFLLISSFLGWLLFYITEFGYKAIPKADIIAIVDVDGVINEGSPAGADKIIPVLKKAFDAKNVKGIVLSINSPGGAPLESERINNFLEAKKKETGKPIVAIIQNVGASAAYMIAVHADKVVAGQYSIVGSVGAILESWDFHRAADRLEIKKRIFQSGKHKGMLNPFTELSPESASKAQSMVDGMGKTFAADVRERRKGKIKGHIDIATGEVWDGKEAFDIGLVDEIGTMETYMEKNWPGIKAHSFNARSGGYGFFGASAEDVVIAIAAALVGER